MTKHIPRWLLSDSVREFHDVRKRHNKELLIIALALLTIIALLLGSLWLLATTLLGLGGPL